MAGEGAWGGRSGWGAGRGVASGFRRCAFRLDEVCVLVKWARSQVPCDAPLADVLGRSMLRCGTIVHPDCRI